ncbi:hypothetical protein FRC17_008987 [Serendipita sp. 399]|nr:hypothetical protein FRC17_008987 [Serendipita sp. 399]
MVQPFRSLSQIPYDVLERIFDLLDNKTLLNACLVNHTVNDIASRSLYATLTVNRRRDNGIWNGQVEREKQFRNAFLVFKRKPMLRLVVKSVSLHPSTFHQRWYSETKNDEIDSECYTQLGRLQNVRKITLERFFYDQEMPWLLDVVPTLPFLTTLVITEAIIRRWGGDLSTSPPEYSKLGRIQNMALNFTGNTIEPWIMSAIAPKIKQVRIDEPHVQSLERSIKALTGLQELTLITISPDPVPVCKIIGDVGNLTHLALAIRFPKWDRENISDVTAYIPETGLTKLTALEIELQPQDTGSDIILLRNLIWALASRSQLRKLSIGSPNSYPPYSHMQCNRLMSHVISTHGPTLEKLKTSFFHLPAPTLRRILSQCKRLRGLWIAVRQGIRPILPRLLAISDSLQTMRMIGTGKWLNSYAGSLLSQTSADSIGSSLREVKVCSVTWEYDEGLGRAVRRLCGPTAHAVRPPPKREVENPYKEDEDDDLDITDWDDNDDDEDEDMSEDMI